MVLVDCPLLGTVPVFIPLGSYHCFVCLEFFAPLLSRMYSLMYLTAKLLHVIYCKVA